MGLFTERHEVIAKVVRKITLGKLDFRTESVIQRYKKKLSKRIATSKDYTVESGCFKGLRLAKSKGWAEEDAGTQCLGLYEKEVIDCLEDIQRKRRARYLIDIGGADGYFALGALVSGLFENVIVYEADGHLRERLRKQAEENRVLEKLTIRGMVTEAELLEVVRQIGASCVILCDIEGGEYEIMTTRLIKAIKEIPTIIELHRFTDEMKILFSELRQRIAKEGGVFIQTKGRDLSSMAELDLWSDHERALLISESRCHFGTWAFLPGSKE